MTSIMTSIQVYSNIFLDAGDQWCARPTTNLMRRLYNRDDEGSSRWIAVIRNGEQEGRIAVGEPIDVAGMGSSICMPTWFLEGLGIEGSGDEAYEYNGPSHSDSITIDFEKSEDIPRATKLAFRALGDIPEWLDIREILEEPLSQLGILQQGQIIPVPAFEHILLMLEVCEPADGFIFLDGAEISLEILSDPVEKQEDVYAPSASASASPEDFDSMVMPAPAAAAPAKPSFIPFQGKGYSLR